MAYVPNSVRFRDCRARFSFGMTVARGTSHEANMETAIVCHAHAATRWANAVLWA